MMRIMDGLWIVIFYLMVTFQISTHVAVDRAMWPVGSVAVSVGAILLWVLFHRQGAHTFMNGKSWAVRFIHLLEEIHRLGHWRELGISMAIGGLYWIVQALAIWAVCRADNFYFDASAVMFILIVKTVVTLVPGAPANMGLYQAGVIYALQKLFADEAHLSSLAEIMFVVLTLPLILGGAIAIASAGFNLSDLHRHAHRAHSTHKLRLKNGTPQEGD
jgi:hypothetical protein